MFLDVIRSQGVEGTRMLVFVNTKQQAGILEEFLANDNRAREQALNTLQMVLVFTDEGARDIDTPDVAMVVSFDMPKSIDDYVHRICRAGCSGNEGSAISFFTHTHKDAKIAHDLTNLLAEARQEVPCFLDDLARNGGWE